MDTLAINERLIASGAPESQAKAHAQIHEEQSRETKSVVKEEVAKATEGFVTRAEFIEAMARLRQEAREDNAKVREDLAKLRQEMADRDALSAWRTAGLVIAMTGIFSIIVKLL